MTSPMRLVIFGAGAVGSLLGARLTAAGTSVLLVARPSHAEAIAKRGLTVEDSPPIVVHPAVSDRLRPGTVAEGVLLTVKSFDLDGAAEAIARAFPAGIPVFALQNGLGIGERLADRFAKNGWTDSSSLVIRAVSSVPATFVGPGVVRPGGKGEVLLAGLDGVAAPEIAERLRRALSMAGLTVRLVPDIQREVWRKAIINAAINPVTADHQVLNGSLSLDPWRGQSLALLLEARNAAELAGFDFTVEEVERDLWAVVKATAQNRSSMLQDMERGRPTEIDAISGELVAMARAHGLPLPATER
ncbi:MAG: 2-dehydropantoate 2-reductase, partial [Thermoplasmata archaeon]|nr:2-dehydropantoate 2-reductase [Thermoplasmata archaeon]